MDVLAAAEHGLPRKGDIIAGKYQIEGILGRGGMGAVYKVSHRVTSKTFAVKWLLPEASSGKDSVHRFIREAQVAGRVQHPNVVDVYDVGEDGGSFYMVMELLEGESLAQRMAATGQLPAGMMCQIMIAVTRGVAAAHRAGIVHRDLKPDNIFLCADEWGHELPKVLDFGISKFSNLASEVNVAITRNGEVMGTPHYMAPEQVKAQPVDERTDVYALGVIMYQMLAAALPFPGSSFPELVLKIMTEAPLPLTEHAPHTPRELVEIVARAMARDPAQRFQNMLELGSALEPFADPALFDRVRATTSRPVSMPSVVHTPLATEADQVPLASTIRRVLQPRTLTLGALSAIGVLLIGWNAFAPTRVHTSTALMPASKPKAERVRGQNAPTQVTEELPQVHVEPYTPPTPPPPTAATSQPKAPKPVAPPAPLAAPGAKTGSTPTKKPKKALTEPSQLRMKDFL